MILVDTSVWIDHLHQAELQLVELLLASNVAQHPMVVGELALGSIRNREDVLQLLTNLPSALVAEPVEVLRMVSRQQLFGRGLGYVDANLLASAILTPGTALWTRDKRLAAAALEVGVLYRER